MLLYKSHSVNANLYTSRRNYILLKKINNNRVFVVSFSSLFSLKAPIRDATAVWTDMSNRSQIAASLSNVLMLAEDLRQSLCYGARNVAD